MVVHDAARPLVSPRCSARRWPRLRARTARWPRPVTDTVKEAGPDRRVVATLDRSRLWAIQTPQAFRREALERALDVGDDVLAAATDDAWLVERAGGTRGRGPVAAGQLQGHDAARPPGRRAAPAHASGG